MTRYVTRAHYKPVYIETPLWESDRESLKPDLSVDGAKEVDTGLVSASGQPIMRVADPIGFGRESER